MPKKTYKVGEEVYDIEDSDVSSFLKDMPDAIEVQSFVSDKDTFDIPVNEVQSFLKDMPTAKPLYDEKKSSKWRISTKSTELLTQNSSLV